LLVVEIERRNGRAERIHRLGILRKLPHQGENFRMKLLIGGDVAL
jgi:hypothetical protein